MDLYRRNDPLYHRWIVHHDRLVLHDQTFPNYLLKILLFSPIRSSVGVYTMSLLTVVFCSNVALARPDATMPVPLAPIRLCVAQEVDLRRL